MPQLTNDTLIAGRYRLDSRLDTGGRAQVWTATDEELNRPVAVKILLTPPGSDSGFIDSFRAEAQLEAKLEHPGIVEVFDWGHDDDANFVVMDLLDGQTASMLLSGGPLSSERVIGVGRQIASALAYAHAQGVAHGSIGADHVMVAPDGQATLIDFGLQCRGTCEYPAAADADTYAVGLLLYELLTGSAPTDSRPASVPDDQLWPAHPHKLVADVPAGLDRVVMRAISADPAERYRTAAELLAALDELARPKSRMWLWATIAVLAVVLAAGATWFVTTQPNTTVPDVVGTPSTEAQSSLSAVGLSMVVSGQVSSDAVSVDGVVTQDPAAGTRVRRGTQVGVTISTGQSTVTVPSITGLDLQTASGRLSSAGLAVGTVTTQVSTAIPANSVITQSPAAGAKLAPNSAVDLVVSVGQAQVTVPDVRGKSEGAATSKLVNSGLVVDVARTFSSQPKGTVVNQGPTGGTVVNAGSTVTIAVSKGLAPVQVPNVKGAQQSDAKTSLQNLGLVPVSVPTSGTPAQVGLIISQSPSAGTKVAPGSQVKIRVGK